MKQINYILVNEKSGKNPSRAAHHRFIPHIGHCLVCDAGGKWNVTGSKERTALIDQLCKLRRHHPDAKILGVSELPSTDSGTYSSHAPIRVNPEMNALRRELSDLP